MGERGAIRKFGELSVAVYPDRLAMGREAAMAAAVAIASIVGRKGSANVVFAAAPSQEEFLSALASRPDLPWDRVVAMHMDEYVGLPEDAPQRFAAFLDARLFTRLPFKAVHRLDSAAADPEAECSRYADILASNPVDLVCLGVGENGHIAFNDPPVADFSDPKRVKVVELDRRCREQQVHDGCFPSFDAVPARAMTLTVPALLSAGRMVCVVPGPRKAEAVRDMLLGPIATSCPASILRRHPGASLFLDPGSAAGTLG